MRLVSFGERGAERAGVLRADRIVPVQDLHPSLPVSVRGLLAGDHLPNLARLVAGFAGTGIAAASVRLGPPVTDPQKIICIGLNYKDHAKEQDKPFPDQPLLFCKTANTLAGATEDIRLPRATCAPDYEVELAVVIGRRARGVSRDKAMEHVAGFMVGDDVSARLWQRNDVQWYRAKSADGFYPCGPALVTADEVPEIAKLRLTTKVNGELRQDASADLLIHDVPALIAYISRDITLEPGDVISTGTPAGVGCFRKPPAFLAPNDVVECAISGLGGLRNRVVAADA
jgi:2,4-didehydro-3-deoxy-L-rhamnonate hydrolase